MNDFVEWLDANRSADVSAIFHDTVAQFEQLRAELAASQAREAKLREALKRIHTFRVFQFATPLDMAMACWHVSDIALRDEVTK